MALAVKEDAPADPGDIGLLGARAVVPGPEGLAHAVEQAWLRCVGWRSFAYDG
jgi:hypothetical protein